MKRQHREFVPTLRARQRAAETQAHLREANERLVVATLNAQSMTERAQAATAQMAYMAEHDFLTGLPNRALLGDRLAQAIALAQRYGRTGAVLYVDLDQFKHINDSLGHHIGDQLLQMTASRLQAGVRASDTVSRQGGDEFVVLLPEVTDEANAVATAEKIIALMAEPQLIAGHRLQVSVSIGLSVFPDDAHDADTALQHADTAMYHAKHAGRDTYRVFSPDMNARTVARGLVEQALRHALEHRDFVVLYQPQVNLQTGAITGAEALLRMRGPGVALISPADFMATAEECGLILPIGHWVLREACRHAATWCEAGLAQIAVNVSASELRDPGFFAGLCAILQQTGLAPHRLELELSESCLIHDTERTASTMRALKQLGVKIAVDDFGTGFSSLSSLRRFPIDTLKVDRSLVRELSADGDNAVVSAVIAMGRSLKQRVVAKGIELPLHRSFLLAHQCTEGQGYFFGRPVDAAAFADLLSPRATGGGLAMSE